MKSDHSGAVDDMEPTPPGRSGGLIYGHFVVQLEIVNNEEETVKCFRLGTSVKDKRISKGVEKYGSKRRDSGDLFRRLTD